MSDLIVPEREPPVKAGRRLFGIVGFIANAMLVVMVFAILFQVVARYVFAHPPFWTEELARYAMIWSGTLGAAIAFWRGVDPRFIEPNVLLPERHRWIGAVVAPIPALIFSAVLLYEGLFGPGLDFTRGFIGRNLTRISEALDLNMGAVAASIPIMALLVLVAAAMRFSAILRRRGSPL